MDGSPARKRRNARERTPVTPLAYGIPDVAAMLGCSPEMVRLEVLRGHLAAKRLGKRVLITAEELRRYVAALEDA